MDDHSVREICREKHISLQGVSYIGKPKSNTVMYVSKKVENLVEYLADANECLVFAEEGINIKDSLLKKHLFIFTRTPQADYARFTSRYEKEEREKNRKLKFILAEGGYYVSETAVIGREAYIEPGCVIGHHVVIGDHAVILAGSVIQNANIGNYFVSNEKAVTGCKGFTITEDSYGNKIRIPSLGRVVIGDYVEIGVQGSIARGSGGNTQIEDHVKMDAMVYVGHDVWIGKNVEIAAGCVLGGFAQIGENSFLGLNSEIRNRISIGRHVTVGMGACIRAFVEDGVTIVGNPAKIIRNTDGLRSEIK